MNTAIKLFNVLGEWIKIMTPSVLGTMVISIIAVLIYNLDKNNTKKIRRKTKY